jgi:hypothetical protein
MKFDLRRCLIFSFAAAVALIFMTVAAQATPALSGTDLAKYQNCKVDDDCVYAQNGSCDCNNGGMGVAVNKTLLTEFRKNFEATTCTVVQGASCTDGLPRCEQNKCLYYAHIIPRIYTGKKRN